LFVQTLFTPILPSLETVVYPELTGISRILFFALLFCIRKLIRTHKELIRTHKELIRDGAMPKN